MRKKVLWIGDACVSTGFAKITHAVCSHLHKVGWDVKVLGINYQGDPHPFPFDVYPCTGGWPRGDSFGIRRLPEMVRAHKPDLVFLLNDPWNVPKYVDEVRVPMAASIAVDGRNCRGQMLNGLKHVIFWTEFGQSEAHQGGYRGSSEVIPLGVDLDVFRPVDRAEALRRLQLIDMDDAFIVGNVNRNQPRKRLDLMVAYFAEWVKTCQIPNAYLLAHLAPTGDRGYDIDQLASYYKVANRLILVQPEIGHGVSDAAMRQIYGAMNVQVSTTQGEGWGLTTMEGMACGVPQLVPDWAALGEWAAPAAELVKTGEICVTPGMVNAIGAAPDRADFIAKLQAIYEGGATRRSTMAEAGLTLARESKYRWENIALRYEAALDKLIGG